MRDDEQVALPEEHVELEIEGEDGGRGGDDEGGEGGAERHLQQEGVGGTAPRPEALSVRGATVNFGALLSQRKSIWELPDMMSALEGVGTMEKLM